MSEATGVAAGPGGGIGAAMTAIIAELGAIGKNSECRDGGFRYSYRSVYDFYNAINPLLARHGVYMLARVLDFEVKPVALGASGRQARWVLARVAYRFMHRDGSWVESEAMGEGVDSSDKAMGKALSYAHKYCLQQVFCIPTQDMDDPDASYEEFAETGGPSGQPAFGQTTTPATGPASVAAAGRQEDSQQAGEAARQTSRARAAVPAGGNQAQREMRAWLSRRHNGMLGAMLADVSGFLGRKVRSMGDVSDDEAAGFLLAVADAAGTGARTPAR